MNGHVGGLVEDDEVLVLINNGNGQAAVGDQGAGLLLEGDLHHIAGKDWVHHPAVSAVDRHAASLQLYDEPVGVAVAPPEEVLEPLAVGAGRYCVAKGFHLVSTRRISPI